VKSQTSITRVRVGGAAFLVCFWAALLLAVVPAGLAAEAQSGASLATAGPGAAAGIAAPEDSDVFEEPELPTGCSAIVSDMHSPQMRVHEAVQMIQQVTQGVQFFCTQDAGNRQFSVFSRRMEARDLIKSIVHSQGLAYHVEGQSVHIMTREEYGEQYGARRVVDTLENAPADSVARALTEMLQAQAGRGGGGKVTAIPEAGALIIHDTPANIAVAREIIERIDRPLETRVVVLENASAAQVAGMLQQFLTREIGRAVPDQQANQVAINDLPGRVDALAELAMKMDVEPTRETRQFRLKHAECTTVAGYLADMFGLEESAPGETTIRPLSQPEPAAEQPPGREAPGAPQRGERGGEAGERAERMERIERMGRRFREVMRRAETEAASTAAVGTVVPDPRTNSVWVTDTPERLDEIRGVVDGLDVELETKTYVFAYAEPAELGLEEKLAPMLLGTFDSLQVDERTHSVSVTSTPERVAAAMALFEQLDEPPRQVFITGKLLSVNRDRLRDIGVTYQADVDDMDNGLGTNLDVSGSFPPVVPDSPLGTIDVGTLADDHFNVLIEMLESDSTTRVLSSPRVLVLDGREAVFDVSTEEPYTVVEIDDETGNRIENVQFKPVGVNITVTPRISREKRVRMEVNMRVSTLQELRAGVPVVSSSQMTSSVLVDDGRPLVTGGLITDQNVDTETKVPLLGDIPLVGALFRNKREDRAQREIVLLIVPNIVDSSPLAGEPVLDKLEEDLVNAPYLEGEKGEAGSPAGAGVPSKRPEGAPGAAATRAGREAEAGGEPSEPLPAAGPAAEGPAGSGAGEAPGAQGPKGASLEPSGPGEAREGPGRAAAGEPGAGPETFEEPGEAAGENGEE